jgi:hypothetical protein
MAGRSAREAVPRDLFRPDEEQVGRANEGAWSYLRPISREGSI